MLALMRSSRQAIHAECAANLQKAAKRFAWASMQSFSVCSCMLNRRGETGSGMTVGACLHASVSMHADSHL